MTNFSRLFALEALALAGLLVLAGCGAEDGASKYAEACEAFAVRNYQRASELLNASLSADSGNADGWVMLARSELALGRIPEAEAAIVRAAQLAAGDSDVLELSAQIAFYAKDCKTAVERYSELANDRSRDPSVRSQAWSGLGVVEMSLIVGDQPQLHREVARICFLRAIRLDGRNAAARYHLGSLYRNAYGYNSAALDQLELFARLGEASDERVRKVREHDICDLREVLSRELAQLPGADSRDGAASQAALKRADEAFKKGNFKTAKKAYAEALKCDPLSYAAAIGLAKSVQKTDKSTAGRQAALKCYLQASLLRPSSRDTLVTCADLAYSLSNWATAVEAYSRAVAVSPANTTAIDGLIRSLRKAGNAKAAAIYQDYRDSLTQGK